jgi:hypothetical protein
VESKVIIVVQSYFDNVSNTFSAALLANSSLDIPPDFWSIEPETSITIITSFGPVAAIEYHGLNRASYVPGQNPFSSGSHCIPG